MRIHVEKIFFGRKILECIAVIAVLALIVVVYRDEKHKSVLKELMVLDEASHRLSMGYNKAFIDNAASMDIKQLKASLYLGEIPTYRGREIALRELSGTPAMFQKYPVKPTKVIVAQLPLLSSEKDMCMEVNKFIPTKTAGPLIETEFNPNYSAQCFGPVNGSYVYTKTVAVK